MPVSVARSEFKTRTTSCSERPVEPRPRTSPYYVEAQDLNAATAPWWDGRLDGFVVRQRARNGERNAFCGCPPETRDLCSYCSPHGEQYIVSGVRPTRVL